MNNYKTTIYWIATTLVAVVMLASGIAQLLQLETMKVLILQIEYPLYIMYLVGAWKVLGVIVLVIPQTPLLKEWAYAGFFFLMTGVLFSLLAVGDFKNALYGPFFQSIFLITSWYCRPNSRRLKEFHYN
jgi:uncharacterized membrane protein